MSTLCQIFGREEECFLELYLKLWLWFVEEAGLLFKYAARLALTVLQGGDEGSEQISGGLPGSSAVRVSVARNQGHCSVQPFGPERPPSKLICKTLLTAVARSHLYNHSIFR